MIHTELITGQDNDDDSCYSGDIRLRNISRITFPYGSESLTGRVEACLNGTYVDVCGDTQYAQYFGDNSCHYLRFSKLNYIFIFMLCFKLLSTDSTVPYQSLYSYANSSRFVDFQNCGDDLPYDPFQNCNITETCQSDPLIVKCELGMYDLKLH